MRVAPRGIIHAGQPVAAIALDPQCTRLTHGHPTGYLCAGVFAAVIADVLTGKPLQETAAPAQYTLETSCLSITVTVSILLLIGNNIF